MRNYLVYDTETSDFLKKNLLPTDPKQAWICQFAAKLINEEGNVLMSANILQRTNGREIKPIPLSIHGKSPEMCDKYGISDIEFYTVLLSMFKLTDVAVCHNVNFDGAMLLSFARAFEDAELYNNIKATRTFCTMLNTTKMCGLTQKNGRTPKWPKLEELHRHLFNRDFDNAHDAMADVNATVDCFLHPEVQAIMKAGR